MSLLWQNWLIGETNRWRQNIGWDLMWQKVKLIGRDLIFYLWTSFFTQLSDKRLLRSRMNQQFHPSCVMFMGITWGNRSLNIGGKRAQVQHLGEGTDYMDNSNGSWVATWVTNNTNTWLQTSDPNLLWVTISCDTNFLG